MPESARWMVAKGKSAAEVIPALARFEPGIARIGYTEVTLSDERDLRDRQSPWAKFVELFRGALVYITPIIWFTYFCSSFAIYLKSSFGVLFLTRLGVEAKEAANIGSITGITGAILGVLLLMATERRGPGWVAVAPLLGVPAALFIGLGLFTETSFIPTILFGGILIGAGHAAVISLTSIYYPSAVRATGGGWASFMAKFAAVAAPLLASQWFLSSREAVLNGYVFTGICLGGVVFGLILLAHFARRLRAEQDAEALAATAGPLPAGASA
jgi:AAHS family 4-hydroxybenzoate transporter-like MFS transporter